MLTSCESSHILLFRRQALHRLLIMVLLNLDSHLTCDAGPHGHLEHESTSQKSKLSKPSLVIRCRRPAAPAQGPPPLRTTVGSEGKQTKGVNEARVMKKKRSV